MQFLKKIQNFYNNDIQKRKGFFYACVRVFVSSVLNFINNNGFDKASTLTYYSLLSMIPLFTVAFGVAQIFGFAPSLTEQINTYFSSQPEVAEKLVTFSEASLKTTQNGFIAGLSIFLLVWTSVNTIGSIERFFNEIWNARTERTLMQKVKSFIPLVLFFPILIVAPSSLFAFSMSITKDIAFVGPLIKIALSFSSYVILWASLSFIYIYLPNTKVSWTACFTAAVVTGVIFLLWQSLYIMFQVQATSYGTIYGSFAALPLFLIWLNYSWIILIFGAGLAREIQLVHK